MTNVLIVDDSRVARSYMQSVVNDSPDYNLVGVLSSTDMADIACRRNAVDMVLMDVCIDNTEAGINAAAALRRMFPKLKMIIVTSMVENSYIDRAREAGADSFWYKDISPEELIDVMNATMQGRHIWPDDTPTVKLGISTSKELTDAQLKVLRLVCEGLQNAEIAQKLNISVRTVKWHISQILEETGFSNKTQLAVAVTGKRLIIPKLLSDSGEADGIPLT